MTMQTYDSTVSATQEQVNDLVLAVLPAQGQWSEDAYLWLTDHTTRLIEFTDGYIEVLPMPTDAHQTLVLLLYELLAAFLRPRGGKVLVAPYGSRFAMANTVSPILCWCARRMTHAARTVSGSVPTW